MKCIIEFEADGLKGQDVSTPLLSLTNLAAVAEMEFRVGDSGDASGLTPDGRELKISWRVEA